ncbi:MULTISPECIES: CPBP family intramembrane glutamic endopeptidase [unclassified Knoellia]|uniref:CPBP family intramembrane glutamic endopeptidase n=1 Tax=Knoellia altitudinis TaxID=3404795 RepID=UPI003620650D
MNVRIAVVGDPGQEPHQRSLSQARALSVGAAADLEWSPFAPWELGDGRLDGFDALWLMAWPQDAESEPVRRAAWVAHQQGTAVVVSPTEPPRWFVELARQRAAYRIRGEVERTRAAELEAAEREPRTYVHQMRGPRHRWWRPLVALAVAVAVAVACVIALLVPSGLGGLMDSEESLVDPLNPWAALVTNLLLASLIPATLVGVWAGFRRSPWRVLSVAGRLRWGWLGWCTLVVTPLWAAYLAVSWVVFEQEVLDRPDHWAALIVVTLLTTPLQAAGEELAFRGGLVQGVGAWFRSPVVALIITAVLSTAFFAAAHGSADPWIIIELGSLALAGCWLAWRTGGLEAVIVLHVVNNLLIMVTGILLGGLEESFVDGASEGSPVSAAMNVVATALVSAVLLWLARRRGVAPAGWRTPARA